MTDAGQRVSDGSASGRGWRFFAIGLAILAVAMVVLAFGNRVFGFQILCDASAEMEPTVRPGECVLTVPAIGEFRRGDVVAFESERGRPPRLGRIVALSKEGVTLRDGVLTTTSSRFFRDDPGFRKSVARLDPVEGLPPQEALTRWRQSNSTMKREVWPDGTDYLVYFRDDGEPWRRHALDAPLGPGALVVAPDNRDESRPDLIGGSAVTGVAATIVWAADKERLFSRPR